ncbi:MAG: TldD/PmbA family protein [Clostridiales bacterium]|nr:TldD/PmbA family protein [Clostridiales bacterium]
MNRELQAAKQALEHLLVDGVHDASVSASTSRKSEFTVDSGKFNLLRTTLDHSLGLMAIKGHCRGTVSGNSFEEEAIKAAARDCIASAEAGQPDEAWEIAKVGEGSFVSGAPEPDMDKLFTRTKELLDSVKAEYPKVMLEQVVTAHTTHKSVYLNNHGVQYESTSGSYSVSLMFSGHEGEQASSFNYCGLVTDKLDTPFIELSSFRQNLKDAERQIHTRPVSGKFEGTVIFTPDCLGGMIGELLGNFVSDGVLLDGTSLWKDALNTQVADPKITISMNPSDPRIVNGQRYTGEGFLAEDYDIIKNGVLKQFMLSAYGANKVGGKRAPNSSYAMIIKPGTQSIDEIIKNTKRGLLVSRYSGGAAGNSGEFSGVAKNSFLIEDGQIKDAVSETMIAGNLAGMLNKLVGISRETVEDGGSSLPFLAVDGITISGQ